MSTLIGINCSCEIVQKDKSVAIGAFSLDGHDSLYSILAKNAVLMLPTLAQKSTNTQSTYSITPLANNTGPAFLFGGSMTCHSKLSLHFLVEALNICQKVSHCICNMHHVLTHSYVFFKYNSILHYPPSNTGGINAYTKVTALELFLLHKEFSHCTLAMFKKGNKTEMSNYRPISLLKSLPKVFEKVIYKRLHYHIKSNIILAKEQYGFRNNSSNEIASYNLINNTLKALNSKCGLEVFSVI
jgi:hypothetical protein